MVEQVGHPPNHLEASLLEAALEATADGILIVDRQGRIVRFNRRFAELWRIPEAILASGEDRQALEHVLSQLEDPEGFLRQVQALYAAPEAESVDVLRFTDGRVFERISRPQRLGDEIVGRVWSFRDVSDRERAESRARHQTAQMTALGAFTRALMQSLEPTAVVGELLKAAQALIPGASVRLRECEADGETLRVIGSAGLPDAGVRTRTRLGDGLAGQAALKRTTLICPDVATDPRYVNKEAAAAQGLVSATAVPLVYGNRLLGVLSIYTPERHEFSQEEMDLLGVLADDAAVAMEHTRMHHASVLHGQQLARLSELTKRLMGSLDIEQVGAEILGAMQTLIPGSIGRLWDLEGGDATMRLMASVGLRDAYGGTVRFRHGEGMAGIAAMTRKAVRSRDLTQDPRFVNQAWAVEEGIRSAVILPLLYGDWVHGILAVMRRVEQEFTDEETAILENLAGYAAVALANAWLHRETVRRGEQLESLLRALKTVTSGLDLREILDRIIVEAARIANTPHVKIVLLEEATQELRVALARAGLDQPDFPGPLARSLSGTVAATGQPLFVADSQDESRNPNAAFDRQMGLRTYLGLPIKGRHGVLGVVTFNTSEPRTYSDEELSYLASFADQAAIAIENARLYEEIKTHAATLETQVAERTQELTAALREAEAAGRAKTDFLLNVSHELRTPLNAVLGFSELLRGQAATQLDTKQARYLDHIHESGKHLLELINEILDLGKVEAGQAVLQCEAVEVAPLVDAAVTLVGELAHRKGLVVHSEIASELPSVSGDPVRLKQILFNLLSNAVKFTPPGGRITVTARHICDLKSGYLEPQSQLPPPPPQSQIANPKSQMLDFVEITVSDTGIGLRAEDMLRLFIPFTQLEDPLRKRHEGTGLGLALTKRLVELHGGTIAASSPGEGQGSTFTVVLPVEGGGASTA